MSGLGNELRAALRGLLRSPGFFAVAAGTLALGLAINAAMFAVVDTIFFKPPPYAAGKSIYSLTIAQSRTSTQRFDPPALRDLRDALRGVGSVASYNEEPVVVAAKGSVPEQLPGLLADAALLRMLDVHPRAGRLFSDDDTRPGADPVVLVSAAYWRSALRADDDVIGQQLRVEGVERTIVGILPDEFSFPDVARIYIPVTDPEAKRVGADINALVRLRSAQQLPQALAAVTSVGTPDSDLQVQLNPLDEPADATVAALLAAIAFVLLIACANVANLVLARGTARRHELSVRAALGATRAQLLRYLVLEGIILSGVALAVGLLASSWLIELIVATLPVNDLPAWFQPHADARVLLYASVLATVTVIVSALLPALTVTRRSLWPTLSAGGARMMGEASGGRLRSTFVAVQITLATVLLVSTGLMIRAFQAMRTYQPGYDASAVVHVATHRSALAIGMRPDFTARVSESLSALPGVTSVGALSKSALTGVATSSVQSGKLALLVAEAVSALALPTLALPLVRGRGFRTDSNLPEAVLSLTGARSLFGDEAKAIGATLQFQRDAQARQFMVIGVVADRGFPRRGAQRMPYVYLPLAFGDEKDVRLLVRAAPGAQPTSAALYGAIRRNENDIVIDAPKPMLAVERERVNEVGWFVSLFGSFGFTALLLAALGIYGVVAYSVTQRTREIGLRITLGATPRAIVLEIAASVLRSTSIGLGLGLAAAVAMGMLLRAVLFGVPPADPLTLVAVLVLFFVVAVIAALIPARRAARLHPLEAMR